MGDNSGGYCHRHRLHEGTESSRALPGSPNTIQNSDGLDRQIFERAEKTLFKIYAPPLSTAGFEQAVRDCRERKHQGPPR